MKNTLKSPLPKNENDFISYLVEDRLVGTEEAPLDIAIAKTNMEHLTICGGIGIVTVRTAFTGKAEVGRNLCEILPKYQDQE